MHMIYDFIIFIIWLFYDYYYIKYILLFFILIMFLYFIFYSSYPFSIAYAFSLLFNLMLVGFHEWFCLYG